jgi:hypothetical protein
MRRILICTLCTAAWIASESITLAQGLASSGQRGTLAGGGGRSSSQGIASSGQRGILASERNSGGLSTGSSNACAESKAAAAFSCTSAVVACSTAVTPVNMALCVGSAGYCLKSITDAARDCADTVGDKPAGDGLAQGSSATGKVATALSGTCLPCPVAGAGGSVRTGKGGKAGTGAGTNGGGVTGGGARAGGNSGRSDHGRDSFGHGV